MFSKYVGRPAQKFFKLIDGILLAPASNPSPPTPSATYRGGIYRVEGAAGVVDGLYIIRKTAADTYEARLIDGDFAATGHSHAQLHDPVTIVDTASIDLTLAGQQIQAAALFGTSAGKVSEGNHAHAAIALNDLSDVVIAGPGQGNVLAHDGTDWDNKSYYSFSIGPFYINDVPGTATTQASLGYFNTATTVSRSGRDPKMQRSGRIVGMIITADLARTAGTAIVRARINGVETTFNADSVQLDGTNLDSDSGFTSHAGGVAFTAGQEIGSNVVTSGWTPITANVAVWIVVSLDPF